MKSTTRQIVPASELINSDHARMAEAQRRRTVNEPMLKALADATLAMNSAIGRVHLLRKMASIVSDEMKGLVPCKSGCTHCCHVPVGLAADEAKLIGIEIGLDIALDVEHRTDFSNDPFGYDNPCRFLVDGQCSIYASRPMACRTHFAFDESSDRCSFGELNAVQQIKMTSMANFDVLYVQAMMVTPGADARLNTLREWFPLQGE